MRRQITFVTYLAPDLHEQVQNLERELASVTGSRACLEIWEPHVTVGSEVYVDEDKVDALADKLHRAVTKIEAFSVTLNGFRSVDNADKGYLEGFTKNHIHIRVRKTQELEHLADSVERRVTKRYERYHSLSRPYQPHLTVAFKDLTDEGFVKGRKLLEHRPFDAEMIFDHVAMAIREDDGRYVEHSRFPLAK